MPPATSGLQPPKNASKVNGVKERKSEFPYHLAKMNVLPLLPIKSKLKELIIETPTPSHKFNLPTNQSMLKSSPTKKTFSANGTS